MRRFLSSSEWVALQALDECCYQDSERGGDGWVKIETVADEMGVSYGWAAQLLARLAGYFDFAERRRQGVTLSRFVYAVSESGGKFLEPSTSTQSGGEQ